MITKAEFDEKFIEKGLGMQNEGLEPSIFVLLVVYEALGALTVDLVRAEEIFDTMTPQDILADPDVVSALAAI